MLDWKHTELCWPLSWKTGKSMIYLVFCFTPNEATSASASPGAMEAPRAAVDGSRWAWLPSPSCVVCPCFPRETCLNRAALGWGPAVPTSTKRRCPACFETGGRGKPNGLRGFIELWVVLSSCDVFLFPTSCWQSIELAACTRFPQTLAENWC